MVHNATDGIKVSVCPLLPCQQRTGGLLHGGLRVPQMAACRLYVRAKVFADSRLLATPFFFLF